MRKLVLSDRQIQWLEVGLIVAFSLFPLLNSFPYRINIFLSWEGAYRLYLGQIPYKDFGLPMGFGYWVVPALFFKVFGPYLYTLIKAQVFINIISAFAFRSILRSFKVDAGLRLISLLLFIISYSFFNFWPWYNHSVIVFELIGLAFLLKFIFRESNSWISYTQISLATFFLFFSFFTKQDGGGLAFLIALFLLLYHVIISKKYLDLVLFIGTYAGWACLFILPFVSHGFTYWFNLGQEPHYSRIELWDFVSTTLGESMWEKFYLAGFLLMFVFRWKQIKTFIYGHKGFLFFLFSLGILVQALLFQVTSYTPPDNNIFFHAFMFVYFLSEVGSKFSFKSVPVLSTFIIVIMLWWSGAYWKYLDRKLQRIFPGISKVEEGKISKNTYAIGQEGNQVQKVKWIQSDLKAFRKVSMPQPTVEGINRLLEMDEVHADAKFLNMSELTPLAHEIGYRLEVNKPLWYHKGVGIFQPQIDEYIAAISEEYYDVVLFETIPYLNNFYPLEIRAALQEKYLLVDNFMAPRRTPDSYIEVFVKKPKGALE